MINLQTAAMCNDCSPDILMRQSLADLPAFAQEADLARCRDAPDKVYPSGGERQLCRQSSNLLRQQTLSWCAALRLGRRRADQCRRVVLVGIPAEERWTLAPHLGQRAEAGAVPKASGSHSVQPLHQAMALGFAWRDEDQFNPDVQAQADKLSEAPWRLLATVEGRVIIQLQLIWQPNCCQTCSTCAQALSSALFAQIVCPSAWVSASTV